jgi:hypothetical protein
MAYKDEFSTFFTGDEFEKEDLDGASKDENEDEEDYDIEDSIGDEFDED